MPYIEQMRAADQDWVRLGFFLADIDELIRDVLDAGWFFFDETLRGPVAQAYDAMSERVFERPDLYLTTPFEPPHIWPREYGEDLAPRLASEGLTGQELDAKLMGYTRARVALGRSGGIRSLRRAWRWMRAILQSLGSAFPPGAAILELVDLIENGAQDIEDLVKDGTL